MNSFILQLTKLLINVIIALLSILSFSQNSNNISLKDWSNEDILYRHFYKNNQSNCDSLKTLFKTLNLNEFKSKLYGQMAKCEPDVKLKELYILKNVEFGLHPNRINPHLLESSDNAFIKKIDHTFKEFWKEKDTSFYSEIEHRVALDQKLAYSDSYSNKDSINEIRLNVFKDNTKFLLNFCKKQGYPKAPQVKNFNYFRKHISPSTIAIHADYRSKLTLLNYSIEAAKKGYISWEEPISICITLHTNELKFKDVKPLFLLEFNPHHTLDIELSYLQLYSITKLYHRNMNTKIILYPSISNTDNRQIIKQQLHQIKSALIEHFNFPEQDIEVSTYTNPQEKNLQYVKKYKFTLTAQKK